MPQLRDRRPAHVEGHERTPAPEEDGLPVGELVASVVAGRLSDPKALFAGAGIFAMICLVIGYLVGRTR